MTLDKTTIAALLAEARKEMVKLRRRSERYSDPGAAERADGWEDTVYWLEGHLR